SRLVAAERAGENMFFGLVTYQWGKDWKLPTLLKNCEKAAVLGVELRSTHAHGVEPSLNARERQEVQKRFADSPVVLAGLGSNERFDSPDAAVLKRALEATKKFLVLSHDVGSTGVKVKPDRFYANVPRQKTIEQIGRALHTLGEFAAGYGQKVRLEVHGQCAELPTIKAIMDAADHKDVVLCWNSNAQDLQGDGLEANFQLVRKHLGATLHVRELDTPNYPYDKLIKLLVDTDYAGWVMLEASSRPADRVMALAAQGRLFRKMVKRHQKKKPNDK
ncbi:MAG TPA: sugar phosphate isomerase/epimerase, partial [Planctomycetaceae bacterium]|nr:sugar phosphate isomerase/epimerase [Planctomycetaceae bacterium]